MRGGASMAGRSRIAPAVQRIAAKITQARIRWTASLYCETSTRSARPDATIHQPTPPCSAPSPKIAQSRQRRPGSIQPFIRNHRNGSRNAAPISRPISRCVHSHQKMVLNSPSVMPLLRCRNCGMVLYLSNSACQAASLSGGNAPVTGFHSTIDRPDSVEPRRAADQHHRKDERRHGVKPQPDRTLAAFGKVHGQSCRRRRGPYTAKAVGQVTGIRCASARAS